MLQKWWFKLFIWFAATAFFFLGASLVISVYDPSPTEFQSMLYMQGMMQAMMNSTMGLSMAIEHDSLLVPLIQTSSQLVMPLIIVSIVLGIAFRLRRLKS